MDGAIRRNRESILVVVLSVAGLAVVGMACGGSSSSSASTTPTVRATSAETPTTATVPTPGPAGTETEQEQTVSVGLTEWKITGENGAPLGSVKAGEVKFDVKNDGTTQHEFVLIRTDADPAALPYDSASAKVDEEAAGESPGEADDIDPGQSKTATMRLTPGTYVYICNVPAHYQAGMHGQLTVQ